MSIRVKRTTYAFLFSEEGVLTTDLLDGTSLGNNTWLCDNPEYTNGLKVARVDLVYHLEANQAQMQEIAAKTLAAKIEKLEEEHAKNIAALRAGLNRLQAISFSGVEVI